MNSAGVLDTQGEVLQDLVGLLQPAFEPVFS